MEWPGSESLAIFPFCESFPSHFVETAKEDADLRYYKETIILNDRSNGKERGNGLGRWRFSLSAKASFLIPFLLSSSSLSEIPLRPFVQNERSLQLRKTKPENCLRRNAHAQTSFILCPAKPCNDSSTTSNSLQRAPCGSSTGRRTPRVADETQPLAQIFVLLSCSCA